MCPSPSSFLEVSLGTFLPIFHISSDSPLLPPPPSSTFEDPCDYTGSTWRIQDRLRVLKSADEHT